MKSLSKILIVLSLVFLAFACSSGDYKKASRESAGIAPEASNHKEALILVYGAPTWGWRGWFAIHPWIAVKAENANTYTVYEVIGWRLRQGLPVVRIENDLPDRLWFGNKPKLLKQIKGKEAALLIERIDNAAKTYPWPHTYKIFPGPNSNTFIAWIAKKVPELKIDLPFSAIGSGYLN